MQTMFFHFDQAVDFNQIARYVTVRAKGQNFEIEPAPELKSTYGPSDIAQSKRCTTEETI